MSRCVFFTPLIAMLVAAAPLAAQTIPSACKPVIDAERKQVTIPSHAFETQGPAGTAGSSEERISTGGALYVLDHGKWQKVPVTTQAMLDGLDATLRTATGFACHQLADENVGGVVTAVYQAHSESSGVKSDGKIWIVKSSGLIVRQDSDVDTGDGARMHLSIRYEYTNVHAPVGGQ